MFFSKDFGLNVPFITSDCGYKGVSSKELHSKNPEICIEIEAKSNIVFFIGSNEDHKNAIPRSQKSK